ncbi:hypothetical protein CLF_100886, partial [Clonorchis sinensis]
MFMYGTAHAPKYGVAITWKIQQVGVNASRRRLGPDEDFYCGFRFAESKLHGTYSSSRVSRELYAKMVEGFKSMDYEARLVVLDPWSIVASEETLPSHADNLRSDATPFFRLCLSGERQPLNDKNKNDPGNLGESFDPVYPSPFGVRVLKEVGQPDAFAHTLSALLTDVSCISDIQTHVSIGIIEVMTTMDSSHAAAGCAGGLLLATDSTFFDGENLVPKYTKCPGSGRTYCSECLRNDDQQCFGFGGNRIITLMFLLSGDHLCTKDSLCKTPQLQRVEDFTLFDAMLTTAQDNICLLDPDR